MRPHSVASTIVEDLMRKLHNKGNAGDDADRFRGVTSYIVVGTAGCRSPRHRMAFNSRIEDSKCV